MALDDASPATGVAGTGGTAASGSAAPTARSVLVDWTRALAATATIAEQPLRTLSVIVDEWARRSGATPALVSDRENFTFAELAARQNHYAHWAKSCGLHRGDTVALLMENRPEYVAVWLGLTRIGVVVALLNVNLRGAALAHCVAAASPKAAIVSASMLEVWSSGHDHLQASVQVWLHGQDSDVYPRVDTALPPLSADWDEAVAKDAPDIADRALLIYTSGTTGLPKAANVSHGRILSWALWFAGMLDADPSDRMYDCLPLYHSVGGVVAVGAMLAAGASVAIAPGFAASTFWDDVKRFDCSLAQYIGELCRYMLKADRSPSEQQHRLRAICGNGLREDVWRAFQTRFAIPRIIEFYAASEGTFSLYNMEGEPGAIGRIPSFLAHRFPAAIVRFDEATDMPVRDAGGFCIKVARGEVGEAIGRIAGKGANAFEGYTDLQATERKILRDVFVKGDAWMRTGDLMRTDARGFWYFVDRVGETFRWKGENVATQDVSATVLACAGVRDGVVYGVEVPGHDGRAGMTALSVTPDFDIDTFAAKVVADLPRYARPVFVRITDTIAVTGTFKHQTRNLAKQGFDPSAQGDTLYVLNETRDDYAMLDVSCFDRIVRGERRL